MLEVGVFMGRIRQFMGIFWQSESSGLEKWAILSVHQVYRGGGVGGKVEVLIGGGGVDG